MGIFLILFVCVHTQNTFFFIFRTPPKIKKISLIFFDDGDDEDEDPQFFYFDDADDEDKDLLHVF